MPLPIGALLGEDSAGREVGAIRFELVRLGLVRQNQHQVIGYRILQRLERGCLLLSPDSWDVLLCEVKEGLSVVREVPDELPVEVCEAEELLYVLPVSWGRPVGDAGNLDWVHLDVVVRDDHTEVLNRQLLKLALLRSQVELMLPEALENSPDDFLVTGEV